jgi:hypothetical protein
VFSCPVIVEAISENLLKLNFFTKYKWIDIVKDQSSVNQTDAIKWLLLVFSVKDQHIAEITRQVKCRTTALSVESAIALIMLLSLVIQRTKEIDAAFIVL